jgi:hypothetical protein
MAIEVGHYIQWRWQGVKSCCWLTSIEMLMGYKYDNVYGKGHTAHCKSAMDDYNENSGSFVGRHATYYGLAENDALEDGDLDVWKAALKLGPVLAEGKYGWSRFGWGNHVIVIAGVSRTGNIAFYNPNVHAILPHPMSKISYLAFEKCKNLAHKQPVNGGPFWQTRADVDEFKAIRLQAQKNLQNMQELPFAGY